MGTEEHLKEGKGLQDKEGESIEDGLKEGKGIEEAILCVKLGFSAGGGILRKVGWS